jgi:hypothetical protein
MYLIKLFFNTKGGPLAEFLDDDSGTLSVLVELSRLRVWRNALAADKNPSLDSAELQDLRSSLLEVKQQLHAHTLYIYTYILIYILSLLFSVHTSLSPC